MKTINHLFARLHALRPGRQDSFQRDWDRARADAARFGPSHVAEVDACFSRER